MDYEDDILLPDVLFSCCDLRRNTLPHLPVAPSQSFTIDFKALNETRRINVYTPPGYDEHADQRFPMLYMPDGGMAEDFPHVTATVQSMVTEGAMRPFLVVGIENTERPVHPPSAGMYHGDRSRKQTLVDFGFRLPSALDNRPLTYEEFDAAWGNASTSRPHRPPGSWSARAASSSSNSSVPPDCWTR